MTFNTRARTLWTAVVAAILTAGALVVASPAAAADEQLVANGDFKQGTTNWVMNYPEQHALSVIAKGHWNTRTAEISVSTTTPAVLNDRKNTVQSTVAGERYTMSAYVRSSRAGATAQLKGREVFATSGRQSNETHLALRDTAWHKLSFDFVAQRTGSQIDLNVQFWGLVVGQKVYVDDVSLVRRSASPSTTPPAPTPIATPSPTAAPPTAPAQPGAPGVGSCTRPSPKGNLFGASISTSGQTTAQAVAGIDAQFGRVPALRVFDPGMPVDWSSSRTQVLKGRTVVLSFRADPADVMSGAEDAALRKWFTEAPSDVTVYWSYIHEPETPIDARKDYTASQYRSAWRHIDAIADSVCRQNMFATLILMGWTTVPGSNKDWRDYYAGSDVIDVLAFDPYNGAANAGREGIYASPASIFDSVRRVAAEAGKPYGIAETGSLLLPTDDGAGRARWLRDVAAYHRANGALFVTYFQSTNGGEYRLLDSASQSAWRDAVGASRY